MPFALYLAFGRGWGLPGLWAGPCTSLLYCNLCALWVIARSSTLRIPETIGEIQAMEQPGPSTGTKTSPTETVQNN